MTAATRPVVKPRRAQLKGKEQAIFDVWIAEYRREAWGCDTRTAAVLGASDEGIRKALDRYFAMVGKTLQELTQTPEEWMAQYAIEREAANETWRKEREAAKAAQQSANFALLAELLAEEPPERFVALESEVGSCELADVAPVERFVPFGPSTFDPSANCQQARRWSIVGGVALTVYAVSAGGIHHALGWSLLPFVVAAWVNVWLLSEELRELREPLPVDDCRHWGVKVYG